MVERWDINIYVVEKTTVVPLSVCRAFLVIMYICLTNHVLLWFNKVNFFQEILTKAIFSQNGRTHRYKYLCRMKDHYSSLECMPSLFRYNLYLRDISGSFFAHEDDFCKKCLHKQIFFKMVERCDINIYVVWKTTVVPLSVCRACLVITCICVTNHVLLWFNKVNFFQEILT